MTIYQVAGAKLNLAHPVPGPGATWFLLSFFRPRLLLSFSLGLLVVSLCAAALAGWRRQGLSASSKFSSLFKKAKVRKEYVAICHGDPGFDSLIDAPLYRRSSGKVAAVEAWDKEEFGAKDAQTRVRNVATAAGGGGGRGVDPIFF